MTNKTPIAQCPVCGSACNVFKKDIGRGKAYHAILCGYCGMAGPAFLEADTAVDVWNQIVEAIAESVGKGGIPLVDQNQFEDDWNG